MHRAVSAPLLKNPPIDDDCRCLCGSLLARIVGGAVELKCRRCKRTVLVPLEAIPETPRPETVSPESSSRVRTHVRVGATP